MLLPETTPSDLEKVPTTLTRSTLLLLAVAAGVSVGNVYVAQPLLDEISLQLGLSPASSGLVVTVTQVGYALGLFLLVPLGDWLDRRRLVAFQLAASAAALATVAFAPNQATLLCAVFLVGLLAVVVQVLVALTADLALPEHRGRAVGRVTGGVVLGILMARSLAGALTDIAGWRAVYLSSAVLTFVLACALYRALPDTPGKGTNRSYPQLLRSVVELFVSSRVLRFRACLALLLFATFGTLWTSLVLPLSSPPVALSHTAIGLFGLAGVAGAVAAGRAGVLADRGWAQWTTGIGLVLLFLSWWPIRHLHQSLVILAAGIVLLDFAVQAVHVTNQSILFAAHPDARSRVVAAYMMFYSAGSGLGAIASTSIYARFGWTGVCTLGMGFSASAFLLWALNTLISE